MDDDVARRLRAAFDLYEVGERMQRARLRRLRPEASVEEIDVMLPAAYRCARDEFRDWYVELDELAPTGDRETDVDRLPALPGA